MTLLFLLFSGSGPANEGGRTLFRWLFSLACLGIVSSSFTITADLFSEERRNGTLGLLVLTGLTPMEIFMNKLLGAMVLTSYGLLAALPFFAVPFLAGGIPPEQFFCSVIFLGNALVFCVAMGLLASVLHREGGQAQTTAIAFAVALCLSGPLAFYASKGVAPAEHWLAASPAYGAYLVLGRFTVASASAFWLTSAITFAYSGLALVAAATILQRTWRDGPEVLLPKRWLDLYQKWAGADGRWKRVLGTNPFCWLVVRERGPAALAHAFLVAIILLWLALYLTGSARRNPANAVLVSIVMHVGLNWILAYAAARRLSEERRNGGLEILLTTPFSTRDLVEGQLRGLLLRFRTVAVFVPFLDLGLMYSGVATQDWPDATNFAYCLAWLPMLWFWLAVHLATIPRAMWIGAWTGRPGYAAIQSMRNFFWGFVWLGAPAMVGIYGASVCVGFFVIPAMALSGYRDRHFLRQKLAHELRAIACAPIPAKGDKKFKRWNPRSIYPPGVWGNFDWRQRQAWKRPGRESLE
jgi:ABC-type transport system involved in multi-copper enzyme maturation permease subunit